MLEIGIVGVPNSGKSTFFKAATLKDVKIASYPFTTIEPNEGLAYVTSRCPCKKLGVECRQCKNGMRYIPLKLWDVAGLVRDAHLGRGRGNAFLDNLMQASALIHVVDCSGKYDSEGNPTVGFDPSENVTMLEREIDFWMLSILKRERVRGSEDLFKRFTGLGINKEQIDHALNESNTDVSKINSLSGEELLSFIAVLRKISKPLVIAANKMDTADAEFNLENLRINFLRHVIVPVSAEIELALREASRDGLIDYVSGQQHFKIVNENKLTERQKEALSYMREFLKKMSTGVQEIINIVVFSVLDMIAVYPVENENKYSDKKGNVLPDVFLMKKGSFPQDLAYKVHEDIGKKFIAAIDAKTHKAVSADYELKDGDVISIRSGR